MRRILLSILLALASTGALAQSYPARPVRIVVAYPPGGSADILARILGAKLSAMWSQPVVVDNKPGASANIGAAFVAKAPPDGYTLLLGTPALAVSAAVFANLTYDAQRDLAPVGIVSVFPNVLVVNPSVPAASVQELVGYAKANPGKLNFASAGTTSAIRFAFENFKQVTGIDAVHVPYKGSAPATQALLAGESQTMMMTLVDALPYINSGKLRALAMTTPGRVAGFLQVPTLAETVAPGFEYITWHGLFAPAGTPPAVIERLNHDMNAVLAQADIKERLTGLGMTVGASTPGELEALLRDEIGKWKSVARIADIKPE
jgi:tripartite-type tricarboxylate transporter receptor subunit TctC